MKILIDTNIMIYRESSQGTKSDIGVLFNWLDRLKYDKYIHPVTIDEIGKYNDSEIVRVMNIKIDSYNVLKTLSKDDCLIENVRIDDKNENDRFDTDILKEVYNNRVDFLVTEDRAIHRKAKRLGCAEKVYKVDSFLQKCISENPGLKDYKVLSIKKEFIGNININDSFFYSFKEDYKEFENWFNRKAEELAYICVDENNQEVNAFLYIKPEINENYNDISPVFHKKKRLKIGTFKVTSNGYKLGERFLKIIFDNAIRFKVEEIYVTLFEKREDQFRLIALLTDWGFKEWGIKRTADGIEKVLIKEYLAKPITSQPKITYPSISRHTRKWLVPIYPDYHTELFPDSILNNESPEDFIENEPHRNAIQKVYISRSYNRNLTAGDLVVFYRTGGLYQGVISTLGVVENVITGIRDENHFIELCRKRSVFSNEQLKEYWNYSKKRPFIVNFLYIDSFPTPKVNLKRLIEVGIISDINSAPRGFEPLTDEKFSKILKEARLNESYFID